jgi:hypothetical protein
VSTTTTDPTTVEDIDLDTGPVCEVDRCPSDNGPAVALMVHFDLCEHTRSLLICQQCLDHLMQGWNAPAIFRCGLCHTLHPCWLRCHIRIVPL